MPRANTEQLRPVPNVPIVRPLRFVQDVKNQATVPEDSAQWVEQGLENGLLMRDDRWSEAIAVGGAAFSAG